jgi:uncharacterized protein YijF (DUF1287 family)
LGERRSRARGRRGHLRRLGLSVALVFLVPLPILLAQRSEKTAEGSASRLVLAALEQTHSPVTYDGAYRRIPYPGGDVPESKGVCTDVVIRAYRRVGVDLQVEVHEDMVRAFRSYPQLWGLSGPDSNIDHRRVPNLQTFFRRAGAQLEVSREPSRYQPGDLVTWTVPPNLPHIGMVTAGRSPSGTPLVVHNIGRGPELEDMLFSFPITGHYRFRVK